ncbi:unnamed protein product [Mytilus coruscus]|uniref:C-type lectin domain-containing protein n=1 Tax=Mytilus coruscus TaxID=42192 RepID=A0A6J8E4G0_MYTCO|nr:unnamed protein product [Mytilus coruscus]
MTLLLKLVADHSRLIIGILAISTICNCEKDLNLTFYNESKTWSDAKDICFMNGGILETDETIIRNDLKEHVKIWLGAYSMITPWAGVFGCYFWNADDRIESIEFDLQNKEECQIRCPLSKYEFFCLQENLKRRTNINFYNATKFCENEDSFVRWFPSISCHNSEEMFYQKHWTSITRLQQMFRLTAYDENIKLEPLKCKASETCEDLFMFVEPSFVNCVELRSFYCRSGLSSTVDGYCFIQQPTDCLYKGQLIKDGTSYQSTQECIDCGCVKGYLSCCAIGGYITSHSANCKVVPDGPCSQKVVLIADETQLCPGGHSGVGR